MSAVCRKRVRKNQRARACCEDSSFHRSGCWTQTSGPLINSRVRHVSARMISCSHCFRIRPAWTFPSCTVRVVRATAVPRTLRPFYLWKKSRRRTATARLLGAAQPQRPSRNGCAVSHVAAVSISPPYDHVMDADCATTVIFRAK